jgi:hypothetical protein
MNHDLKTHPDHFADIILGYKTFEIRLNDRNFKVFDTLTLKEWSPHKKRYTGGFTKVKVIHILENVPEFGLMPGYVIMSIQKANS